MDEILELLTNLFNPMILIGIVVFVVGFVLGHVFW